MQFTSTGFTVRLRQLQVHTIVHHNTSLLLPMALMFHVTADKFIDWWLPQSVIYVGHLSLP
jgi:hypothetical protein